MNVGGTVKSTIVVAALSIVLILSFAPRAQSQTVLSYTCLPPTCYNANPGPIKIGSESVYMNGLCSNGQRPAPYSVISAACTTLYVSLDAEGTYWNPPPNSCSLLSGYLKTSGYSYLYPGMKTVLAWGYDDWECNGNKDTYSSPPARC